VNDRTKEWAACTEAARDALRLDIRVTAGDGLDEIVGKDQ